MTRLFNSKFKTSVQKGAKKATAQEIGDKFDYEIEEVTQNLEDEEEKDAEDDVKIVAVKSKAKRAPAKKRASSTTPAKKRAPSNAPAKKKADSTGPAKKVAD
jgi:hypothetical protein